MRCLGSKARWGDGARVGRDGWQSPSGCCIPQCSDALSTPWVMETFEVLSPGISASAAQHKVSGLAGSPRWPHSPPPGHTRCPDEGPRIRHIPARKSSCPSVHKAISCLAFSFEACPSSGFLQQLGSSRPGPAGGSGAGGREGKKPKVSFSRTKAAVFTSILGPGLLQPGQGSNPVPVPPSPEALQPFGAK